MGIVQRKLYVDGMTCAVCEGRIRNVLESLQGVTDVSVRLEDGTAEFSYDDKLIDVQIVKAAVEKIGYAVRDGRGNGSSAAIGIGVLLFAAYLLASSSGVFQSLPKIDSSVGYAMLILIGMLTSIHCVAMCGGIALSQSVPAFQTEFSSGADGRLDRLIPGLLYNAGRVLSYTALGGVIGAVGGAFDFSPGVRGTISAVAGTFMVFLGLKLLGLLGKLPLARIRIPNQLRKSIGRFTAWIRMRGPFAVGILNGFMPCGPLQTMQVYALGTGSAFAGALSMFLFSVGTVPLMLVFGLTAALLPRKFVPHMVKASAVLVMFLGFVTVSRAAALAGISLPSFDQLSPGSLGSSNYASAESIPGRKVGAAGAVATISDGVQTITTEFKDGYYVPFTVQAGVPLKWTIRVKEEDLNGCNNPVEVPAYKIRKVLVPGDNVIEFTPAKEGTIRYSCWMGMIASKIAVVKDLGSVVAEGGSAGESIADLIEPRVGGGCCSSAADPAFAGGRIPIETIGMPVVKDGVQEMTITIGRGGYSPAAFVLQKGMKAVITFKGDDIDSCNSPVEFPDINVSLDLAKGERQTPPIPVTGDFTFSCWMGMINGFAKAVDDLSNVDIEKVREEIGNYRASAGSGGCCGPAPATK